MKRLGTCVLSLCLMTALWSATRGPVASGAPQAQKSDGRAMVFEIYRDKAEEFRWRLKASNGQVVATSGQGYEAKPSCRHEIEQIKKNASRAEIEDGTAK